MSLNSVIKKVFWKIGLDVKLVRNVKTAQKKDWEAEWAKQWRFLQNYDVKTILDIGANTGQFATMIHRICPSATIISFEPLKTCFEELQLNLSRIPNTQAFNVALGAETATAKINRSDFTPSSSLLDMADLHKRDWPDSAGHSKEKIQVRRLDDMLLAKDLPPDVLVKIDVQGYEANVIKGGVSVLSTATIVVLEVSFRELYQGQPHFDDIYHMMVTMGFNYIGNIEQHASQVDGQILFADAIFENTAKMKSAHTCINNF